MTGHEGGQGGGASPGDLKLSGVTLGAKEKVGGVKVENQELGAEPLQYMVIVICNVIARGPGEYLPVLLRRHALSHGSWETLVRGPACTNPPAPRTRELGLNKQ